MAFFGCIGLHRFEWEKTAGLIAMWWLRFVHGVAHGCAQAIHVRIPGTVAIRVFSLVSRYIHLLETSTGLVEERFSRTACVLLYKPYIAGV